jgi:hypothetical protein
MRRAKQAEDRHVSFIEPRVSENCQFQLHLLQHPLAVTATVFVRGYRRLQLAPNPVFTKVSPSAHEADDHASAWEWWRVAAFLLLSPCRCERTRVAHVVPRGLDPAVGALDVRDSELVDTAVAGVCVTPCSRSRDSSLRGKAMRPYPIRKVTTPMPVEGGVAGGALPMSAGSSFHGRRKPNGSACQRRTMAGSRMRQSTQ